MPGGRTGVGVAAQSATNCHGSSSSGNGISTTNANNCVGTSDSGVGIATTNAITCHGETATGTRGITGRSVSYSTAAHGGGGIAIESEIAVACVVIGSGTILAPEKHLGTP